MLRKSGHIALIFILLFSISGVSLHKHYCMGKLKAVAVFSDAAPCCDEGCPGCDDEVEFYRLDTDLFGTDIQLVENVFPPVVSVTVIFDDELLNAPFIFQNLSLAHSPPAFSQSLPGITMLGNFRL
ncbi:MAG: hypothetical protein Kow00127_17050 [Bacteroidales bacterium]